MATPKTTYQAVVGISFDGMKPPKRVEPGEALPDNTSAEDISWLLEQGLIRKTLPKVLSESEDDNE